ncbi:hypothetical protein ILYODFUR_036611, partial [Ilyodon furcidens]
MGGSDGDNEDNGEADGCRESVMQILRTKDLVLLLQLQINLFLQNHERSAQQHQTQLDSIFM